MRLRLHSWWAEAVPLQAIHEFQDCKGGLSVGSWNVLQPKAQDPNSSKLHIYLEYIWIPKTIFITWSYLDYPVRKARRGYGNPVPNPISAIAQLHAALSSFPTVQKRKHNKRWGPGPPSRSGRRFQDYDTTVKEITVFFTDLQVTLCTVWLPNYAKLLLAASSNNRNLQRPNNYVGLVLQCLAPEIWLTVSWMILLSLGWFSHPTHDLHACTSFPTNNRHEINKEKHIIKHPTVHSASMPLEILNSEIYSVIWQTV